MKRLSEFCSARDREVVVVAVVVFVVVVAACCSGRMRGSNLAWTRAQTVSEIIFRKWPVLGETWIEVVRMSKNELVELLTSKRRLMCCCCWLAG